MSDPSLDDLDRRVRDDIERHGWHVVKVVADEDAPAWAYTIGLGQTQQHPELAIFGMELDAMHAFLNHLGALVCAGRRFESGQEYEGIFEGMRCAFRAVAPRWLDVFFGNAAWHYRSAEVPILQCLWPDESGLLPWEPGFDESWREVQPLLHEAELERALAPRLAAVLRREGALA